MAPARLAWGDDVGESALDSRRHRHGRERMLRLRTGRRKARSTSRRRSSSSRPDRRAVRHLRRRQPDPPTLRRPSARTGCGNTPASSCSSSRRRRGYREFNFSPRAQWAAYRVRSLSRGHAAAGHGGAADRAPVGADDFLLRAAFDWRGRAAVKSWRVGLCAVIEEAGGALSYWALAHPPRRARFPSSRLLCARTPGSDGA